MGEPLQATFPGFTHDRTVGSEDWYTPPEIFVGLKLHFDLDPCAPPGGVPWIPATHVYSLPEDGLVLPWGGRVWLNPPYGEETPRWLERLARHGNGIALVYARTETDWFHRLALTASCLLFVRGRLNFMLPDYTRSDNNAGAGSLLCAWGRLNADALEHSGLGWCTRP